MQLQYALFELTNLQWSPFESRLLKPFESQVWNPFESWLQNLFESQVRNSFGSWLWNPFENKVQNSFEFWLWNAFESWVWNPFESWLLNPFKSWLWKPFEPHTKYELYLIWVIFPLTKDLKGFHTRLSLDCNYPYEKVFFTPPENMKKLKVSGGVEKPSSIKCVNWEIFTRLLLFDWKIATTSRKNSEITL